MTLKLNGSSSGYTAIDAPAAAGSNTLVLPPNNGSAGQVLQTDGNGGLTWVTPGAGKILQVQSAVLTTAYDSGAVSAGTTVDLMTCDITPSATSSKILIQWYLGMVFADSGTNEMGMYLRRDTTGIGFPTSPGSRRSFTMNFGAYDDSDSGGSTDRAKPSSGSWIDSPNSTSAITYRISFFDGDGGGKFYVNRSHDDTDDDQYCRTPSQLILMEIGA